MQKKTKKGIKIALLTPVILLGVYLIYALICLGVAGIATSINTPLVKQNQIQHIENITALYEDMSMPRVNEDDFTTFDNASLGDDVRLNRLRYIATHNSYKQELSPTNFFALNYGMPFLGLNNGPTAYNYGFESLTDQLNSGIRSIELDINNTIHNEYQCVHHCMLDNNSSAINLELAFKEIALWSRYNEGHLPIMVMLEPKVGSFLFGTNDTKPEDLLAVGKMAREILGDRLYTPHNMLSSAGVKTFGELTASNKYPSINSLRGKVMFLLYPYKYTDDYISLDESMDSQEFFPTFKADKLSSLDDVDTSKYCFAVCNDPSKPIISDITRLNIMVRTRMNIFPNHPDEMMRDALDSGANILSTDFPPRIKPNGDYVTTLNNGKTITLSD